MRWRRRGNRARPNTHIIDVDKTGMTVRDIAPGLSFEELQDRTGVDLRHRATAA
jgi:acyl CoA:acetate/3-ketoacid CoA transferase beta subunit